MRGSVSLIIRTPEFELELHRELRTGITTALPYAVLSDGLQNIIMCLAVIRSSDGAVLVFEEPEIHTFPYFTRMLAERIAHDKRNQYFISTHNPYFLHALLEKTPRAELAVFVTELEGGVTKVHPVSSERLSEMLEMDLDVFLNVKELIR